MWGLGFRAWKIRGCLLKVPEMRTVAFGCQYLGLPMCGNYHMTHDPTKKSNLNAKPDKEARTYDLKKGLLDASGTIRYH